MTANNARYAMMTVSEEDLVDNVNHPKHYEGSTSLECIECMELIFGDIAVLNFCLCNAFKYMWRYKNKNGAEDIKKAKWYLDYVQDSMKRDDVVYIPQKIVVQHTKLQGLYFDILDKIAKQDV